MSVPGPGGTFELDGWSFISRHRCRGTAPARPSSRWSPPPRRMRSHRGLGCAFAAWGFAGSSGHRRQHRHHSRPGHRLPYAVADVTGWASRPLPPEPPPAPPPETPQAPVYRPTQRPTETKKPEIGVTRTPVTRSPISVAPRTRAIRATEGYRQLSAPTLGSCPGSRPLPSSQARRARCSRRWAPTAHRTWCRWYSRSTCLASRAPTPRPPSTPRWTPNRSPPSACGAWPTSRAIPESACWWTTTRRVGPAVVGAGRRSGRGPSQR